jgi:hypothetical protein
MKQTTEAKLVELAKAYARHRKALRENAQAIRGQHADAETFVDLKPFRNRYMSGKVTDDPDCSIVWRGWLHAVDTCQEWDCQDLEDDDIYRSMAKLLDERKEINAQGARIRNRLRIIGDQLMRAEP